MARLAEYMKLESWWSRCRLQKALCTAGLLYVAIQICMNIWNYLILLVYLVQYCLLLMTVALQSLRQRKVYCVLRFLNKRCHGLANAPQPFFNASIFYAVLSVLCLESLKLPLLHGSFCLDGSRPSVTGQCGCFSYYSRKIKIKKSITPPYQ